MKTHSMGYTFNYILFLVQLDPHAILPVITHSCMPVIVVGL